MHEFSWSVEKISRASRKLAFAYRRYNNNWLAGKHYRPGMQYWKKILGWTRPCPANYFPGPGRYFPGPERLLSMKRLFVKHAHHLLNLPSGVYTFSTRRWPSSWRSCLKYSLIWSDSCRLPGLVMNALRGNLGSPGISKRETASVARVLLPSSRPSHFWRYLRHSVVYRVR